MNSANVTGDNIKNTKNCRNCFITIHGVENCKNIFTCGLLLKDSHDTTTGGDTSELFYENASGLPQTTLTLVVIPATNAIWQKIEENLGEKIQIVGTFEWGYAETKHFTIKELTAQN